MLKAKVPHVYLDTVFRFGKTSGIASAAHDILHGVVPTSNGVDFFSLTNNEYSMGARAIKAVEWMMSTRKIQFNEIQVLTPTNAGPSGRVALNNLMQKTFNPESSDNVFDPNAKKKIKFRIGDRVIHLKNNRDIGVMNGEIGIVTSMAEHDTLLPTNDDDGSMDFIETKKKQVLTVKYPFHDKDVSYDEKTITQLDLGYAITVHKGIGSEFAGVVLILTETRSTFMVRQLPYTAITRSSDTCAVVSTPGTFNNFVNNSMRWKRFTMLASLLTSN
jgi:exodeoxyribonuclease V alpha subunit